MTGGSLADGASKTDGQRDAPGAPAGRLTGSAHLHSYRKTTIEIALDPLPDVGPVADPSGQGIYYIDVGHQSAGRYLVIVRALSTPHSKVPANPAATNEWQTNVLALDVA